MNVNEEPVNTGVIARLRVTWSLRSSWSFDFFYLLSAGTAVGMMSYGNPYSGSPGMAALFSCVLGALLGFSFIVVFRVQRESRAVNRRWHDNQILCDIAKSQFVAICLVALLGGSVHFLPISTSWPLIPALLLEAFVAFNLVLVISHISIFMACSNHQTSSRFIQNSHLRAIVVLGGIFPAVFLAVSFHTRIEAFFHYAIFFFGALILEIPRAHAVVLQKRSGGDQYPSITGPATVEVNNLYSEFKYIGILPHLVLVLIMFLFRLSTETMSSEQLTALMRNFSSTIVEIHILILTLVTGLGVLIVEQIKPVEEHREEFERFKQRVKDGIVVFIGTFILIVSISAVGLLFEPALSIDSTQILGFGDSSLLDVVVGVIALLCFELSVILLIPSTIYATFLTVGLLSIGDFRRN